MRTTKNAFWDSGMVDAAQSIQRYRDQDVWAKLDSILITVDAIGTSAVVEDAFPGHFDAATSRAMNTRYPELTSECTSDKSLLNKVAAEACGAEIWKRCNPENGWIVDYDKLSYRLSCSLPHPHFPLRGPERWERRGRASLGGL